MVNSNVNALGVIFANTYDNLVPELVAERSMASIPFGGRYRLIDFTLSSMANAGIDNVSVIVRKNYHSLMDHLGAGREWDLTRKRGGLNIVPPFAERSVKLYSGRVDALESILNWLEDQKERYVILSDSYIAMNFDFGKLVDAHVKSGADVTMVYNRAPIPEGARSDNYTIRTDENGRVTEILSNDYRMGEQNLAMNIYVIERESLIHLIHGQAGVVLACEAAAGAVTAVHGALVSDQQQAAVGIAVGQTGSGGVLILVQGVQQVGVGLMQLLGGGDGLQTDGIMGITGLDQGQVVGGDGHAQGAQAGLDAFLFLGGQLDVLLQIFQSLDTVLDLPVPVIPLLIGHVGEQDLTAGLYHNKVILSKSDLGRH